MAFVDLSGGDDEEHVEIITMPWIAQPSSAESARIIPISSQIPRQRVEHTNLDTFLAEMQYDPSYQAHLHEARAQAEKKALELRAQQWQRHQLAMQSSRVSSTVLAAQNVDYNAFASGRRTLPSSVSGKHISAHSTTAASMHDPNNMRDAGPIAPYVPFAQLSFSLVNLKEFTIRASEGRIDALLLPLLRGVDGFRFDESKKRIVFPLTAHHQLATALSAKLRSTAFEPLPSAIITAAILRMEKESRQTDAEIAKRDSEIDYQLRRTYDLPLLVMDALAPFQREAVHFVCNPSTNDGRALIADEMGLGKTRSAIGCICAYREEWPVLIVVPSSARHHWRAELLAVTQSILGPDGDPYLPPQVVTVVDSGSHPVGTSERHRNYKVVIISYNLVDTFYDNLRSMAFGVLVLDECHYLKSSKSKRTRAIQPLAQHCRRCIMLSGTPALSRPMELFSQLNMLDPHSWGDVKEFGKRYCRKKKPKKARVVVTLEGQEGAGGAHEVTVAASSRQAEFSGASNTHELHLLLTDTLMIRRLKRQVLRELPPKHRLVVKVPVVDDELRLMLATLLAEVRANESRARQRKLRRQRQPHFRLGKRARAGNVENAGATNALDEDDLDETGAEEAADDQDQGERDERVNSLMKLFNSSGIAKVPAVLQHVQAFLDDAHSGKLLIFAHHRSVMGRLADFLSARGEEFIQIDGRTPTGTRAALVNQFQNQPAVRVAVLAITAAGVAITLTAAATVFFAEMFWTPGSLVQAEDRAHRIGQTRAVTIKYFLAESTVDDLLWPLVREKMRSLGEIVEGQAADMSATDGSSRDQYSSESSVKNLSSSSDQRMSSDECVQPLLEPSFAREIAEVELLQRQMKEKPAETEVEEEEEGVGLGELMSDDEDPDVCPLVETYLREQRVLRRKREHAVVIKQQSPFVPREERPLERFGLDGPSDFDLLLAESGAAEQNAPPAALPWSPEIQMPSVMLPVVEEGEENVSNVHHREVIDLLSSDCESDGDSPGKADHA